MSTNSVTETKPLVVEKTYNAPVEKVWQALTDVSKMKQWYFDLADFKPEVGFEFQFAAGEEGKSYLHICKVTEAIVNKKIAYTWRYADFPGESEVSFELFDEGEKTKLVLTHTGLDSFPKNNPDFARKSFAGGWDHIINKSLEEFLNK